MQTVIFILFIILATLVVILFSINETEKIIDSRARGTEQKIASLFIKKDGQQYRINPSLSAMVETLGRSKRKCSIAIDDVPDKNKISREHAVFIYDNKLGTYIIKPIYKTKGIKRVINKDKIFVNYTAVGDKGCVLKDGDEILLARTIMLTYKMEE